MNLALEELPLGSVRLGEGLPRRQFDQCLSFLLQLSEDSMLKPFREKVGLPAPGEDIGGWYDYDREYDWQSGSGRGFAPGHCFGQWLSALARGYAITGDPLLREKAERLVAGYAATISGRFYDDLRFPAYTYDKLLRGLLDVHLLCGYAQALSVLQQTTDVVQSYLPPHAVQRGEPRPGRDESYTWDEPYTLPENCFIAYRHDLGQRYLELARRLMIDRQFFAPLAKGKNVLPGRHAYSHINALGSAVQAYLVTGSTMHLRAARKAFGLLVRTQSFATGGWGPDEQFCVPDSGALGKSVSQTHHSFETPCGAYAHLKIAGYLLSITGDSRYGDSMERVIYNTVLGALPLRADGKAFYYSDYNECGAKSYHRDNCPCCAGSLPLVACEYHRAVYLRDRRGLFVNLYINSAVDWRQDGAQCSLKQTSNYPLDGMVTFRINCSSPRRFDLRFRIPAWATRGAWLNVNGRRIERELKPGRFVRLTRLWKTGDVIKLRLPLPKRLEAVDREHPEVVALVRGPLVLFAVDAISEAVSKRRLRSVRRKSRHSAEWMLPVGKRIVRFKPFTAITSERYRTYLTARD